MRHIIALLCLALASACGSTEPRDVVAGPYSLATVNDQPLPYRTSASNVTATLTHGALVISPGGNFSLTTSGTRTIGTAAPSSVSEMVSGSWEAKGARITLTSWSPQAVIDATYSDGSLTYTNGGNTYVYRRS